MRVPTPSPPWQGLRGLTLSDSEKAEALADSPGAQYQLVVDPSDPEVTDVVNEAMRSHPYAPQVNRYQPPPQRSYRSSRESRLATFRAQKALPNTVLRYLPKRAITFVTEMFKAVLRRQY
jgi:hypothetical protein